MAMISAKTFARYAASPASFRRDLVLDVDGVARQFGDVMAPFQVRDFAALDTGLMKCNGRATADAKMRAYLERPRGHSKTTDIAILCVWALAFAARPIRGYAFAADQDQSKLLKDAMATIVRLNPWLAGILNVGKGNTVENIAAQHPGQGGKLEIFSSDVASSYGILPDLLVIDELTNWAGDGSLWHSLISSAAKRGSCFLAVISNAGFADSWQQSVRESARVDQAWYFSRLDGPQASWISRERLAEQERLLPAVAFRRLWLNEWSSGGGDALTEQDIAAAFFPTLRPLSTAIPGLEFVGGLDLGVSRDASAVCILGVRRRHADHGVIRLAFTKVWRPSKGKKVDLQQVEDCLFALHDRFNLRALNYDPWNAAHLASRLQAGGLSVHQRQLGRLHATTKVPMVEVPQTGQSLQKMASVLLEAFADRRLELYPDDELKRDLTRLRVEERQYGFRLTSPRDALGHGDLATAFALAMLAGSDLAARRKRAAGSAIDQSTTDTPFLRALRRHEADADEHLREMAALHAGGNNADGLEDWRQLMTQVGR